MRKLFISLLFLLFSHQAYSQYIFKCAPTEEVESTSLKDTLIIKVFDNIPPLTEKWSSKEASFEEIEESIVQSIKNAFPNAVVLNEDSDSEGILNVNVRIEAYKGDTHAGGMGVSGTVKYTVVAVRGETKKKKVLEESCGGAWAFGKYAPRRQLKRAFDSVNKMLFNFIKECSNPCADIFDD